MNAPVRTVVAQTPRLRLRRLDADDVDALLDVYGDADAMRFVGDGRPLARGDCERWVAVTAANYATRGYGLFAVEDRATGAVVGFCGLVHPGGQAEAELKYALRRACWGRGLATEAAAALLRHAADGLGLTRVIATAAPGNTASHRVLAKAGLRAVAERANDDGTTTRVFAWTAGDPLPARAADGS